MMELFSEKQNCCGCNVCANVCPQGAISMQPDEKGFLYPQIDRQLCTDCGVCAKSCPFNDEFRIKVKLTEPFVFAVKHKSNEVRMESSSGGMFTAISDYILDKGGAVYGACFDSSFAVCHKRATTKKERDEFRGSKYVQSDLKNVYKEAEQDLKEGRYVLFTGTPCQTAGLYRYLENRVDTMKLYLCDVVCHGTPSPKVFKEYLESLKEQHGSEIKDITFRYKPMKWKNQAMRVSFKNGTDYKAVSYEDTYYKWFLQNVILRDACYNCAFTNLSRPSDMTIGDFWGIENCMPEFEDEEGVSLVLVNTPKGKKMFDDLGYRIIYNRSNVDDCMQTNLEQPSEPSEKMQEFWNDYQKNGIKYVLKKEADSQYKGFAKKALKTLGLLDFVKNKKKP